MKTIGELLKEARLNKKLSMDKVESQTKIKKEFIDYIEKGKWGKLPDYPTVQGFIKTLAKVFDLTENKTAALLRRDYPPKDLPISPKPDVGGKFVWSPRATFLAGILLVSLIVLGYLGFQYKKFISPPKLELFKPAESQVVESLFVEIVGQTDPDATIQANNQPILVDEDGGFSIELAISEETSEVEIKAVSRSGKETTIRRNIDLKLNN